MNTRKSPATPERLLLGMAIAFATSLCALEYGKPRYYTNTLAGWSYDLSDEEEIPIVIFQKKPEPPKPLEVRAQKQWETASFIITSPEVVTQEETDPLPEFVPEPGLDLFFEPEPAPEAPLFFVEIAPEFPGGEQALFDFLGDNLNYPGIAVENKISGMVYVQFVVGRDGYIDSSSIEVLGTSHPWLSREAIRVVRKMPRWKPGSQQGRNVPVFIRLPLRFSLKN